MLCFNFNLHITTSILKMATRWGILSAGKISNEFVTALKIFPKTEHLVVAVAARDSTSAQTFAESHNIPKHYGDYAALISDPEVDVIYIGTINPRHFPLAKLAVSHGKHVLCEKPLCMNVTETATLVNLAREKGVFLMEGIWSRAFPAYDRLRKELKLGRIGDVVQVEASIGVPLYQVENCRLKCLGGGSLLNLGIYCVQLATFVFEDEKPEKVVAAGHLNEDSVDESISIILTYKGGRTASLVCHMKVELSNTAFITGTKGQIKLPSMFLCPTSLLLGEETFNYPLPTPVPGSQFNYPGSIGLSYEAQEVRECIKKGLTESPKMRPAESLLIAEIMEVARKQVGVVYDQD